MAKAECLQTALNNTGMTGASLNSLTSFLDLYLCSSGCLAGLFNDGGAASATRQHRGVYLSAPETPTDEEKQFWGSLCLVRSGVPYIKAGE